MLSCGNLSIALKMFLFGLQSSSPCRAFSHWLLSGVSVPTYTMAKQLRRVGNDGKGLRLRQEASVGVSSLKATLPGRLVLEIDCYL